MKSQNKLVGTLCIVMSCLLVACGGGGGGGNSSSSSSSSSGSSSGSTGAKKYPITAGDWLTYSINVVSSLPGPPVASIYETQTVASVQSDGSYTSEFTSSGAPAATYQTNTAGQILNWIDSNESCDHAVPPTLNFPAMNTWTSSPPTLSLGNSWNWTYVSKCALPNSNPVSFNVKQQGSVVGIETITTSAGTFDAFKTQETLTLYNGSQSLVAATSTCWLDAALSRVVKCVVTQVDLASAYSRTFTLTQELVGMSIKDYPGNKGTVARFAGSWEITHSNTARWPCTVTVDPVSGNVNGKCYPASQSGLPNVDFVYFSGSVGPNGELSGTDSQYANYTGGLNSAYAGSGSYSFIGPSASNGTWTAKKL